MALAEVLDLLACPQCAAAFALTADERSVRCASGHVFDLARQGYLNLSRRTPPRNADTAAMVDARDRFLTAGHYRPLADALAELTGAGSRLLDVGTGTGYYLRRLLEEWPHARGVGLDVSVAAARRAARAHPRLGSVVADAWSGLPVATVAVDVVLNVFAPRNGSEFRRVLAPGGVLVTATPEPDHLSELRQALGLLDIQAGKQDQLAASLDAFAAQAATPVRYRCRLDRNAVGHLVAMGPNAFHLSEADIRDRTAALPEPVDVTVAVRVTRWVARD